MTDLYQIDQGDTRIDEATLRAVHLTPYFEAIKAGALCIMISFSSWNGEKLHGHQYLLTDVLKDEFGFKGFLVSDWMAIDQLHENFYDCVVESINAGLDMIMVPFDYKRFIHTLTEAVTKGDIPQDRVDDAVRRILRVKCALGLFEKPLADKVWLNWVGCDEHRSLASEAVRKSLVLLKNDGNCLPLRKDAETIFVGGEAADDIGLACGGWSINWLGGKGNITSGNTLLNGIKKLATGNVYYDAEAEFSGEADIGVLIVAEEPYAEGMGDRDDLTLTEENISLFNKMRQQCNKMVLIIYSGRPLIISDIVDQCDAIIAAWLPGTEAAAIADVLFDDAPFTGKLSYNWPRSAEQIPYSKLENGKEPPQWSFGHGLKT